MASYVTVAVLEQIATETHYQPQRVERVFTGGMEQNSGGLMSLFGFFDAASFAKCISTEGWHTKYLCVPFLLL